MTAEKKLRVTVSGSFHRHMSAISATVQELTDLGAQVLSPADPRVVDQAGAFLYVASDRVRSVRMVQDRHLEAIRSSDFLWLVCPDGYVGQSAAMEIGFATAAQIPILAESMPSDLTLRKYVHLFPCAGAAVRHYGRRSSVTGAHDRFLIDPYHAVEEARVTLERIASTVDALRPSTSPEEVRQLYQDCNHISEALALPQGPLPEK